jgi:hypothetical protein
MKKSLWTIYCKVKSLFFKDMTIGMVTEENTIIFKNGSIIKVIPNAKSEDVIRGKRTKMFNPDLDYYLQHKKEIDELLESYIKKNNSED